MMNTVKLLKRFPDYGFSGKFIYYTKLFCIKVMMWYDCTETVL